MISAEHLENHSLHHLIHIEEIWTKFSCHKMMMILVRKFFSSLRDRVRETLIWTSFLTLDWSIAWQQFCGKTYNLLWCNLASDFQIYSSIYHMDQLGHLDVDTYTWYCDSGPHWEILF